MNRIGKTAALCAFVLALGASPCYAISLVLDYSHDSFFATHLTAKTALKAAAADVSSAITSTLNATVDSNTSTINDSYATFDFKFGYTNPSTGASLEISSAVLPANEVRVFVGVRNLTGNTLGVGGPGGTGYDAGGSYFDFDDFTTAVNTAMAAGNANVRRGGGPVIGNVSTTILTDDGSIPVSVEYGSSVGNLWFDVDTDNNGGMDDDAMLNAYWHYDHTTPVAASKNDFYSVALHEILHSLGIGASEGWDDNVSAADSRDWTGAQVIAQAGSGDNILQPDANHIAEGRTSPRVSDGVLQEVVMDPSITVGTRKKLTNLDLAFLRDIGWQTVAYSSTVVPGDFDGDGDVDGADFVVWQTNFPTASGAMLDDGDADGDGDVDGADFVVWQTNFPTTPGGAVSPVPEPNAWFLASVGALTLFSARRAHRCARVSRPRT